MLIVMLMMTFSPSLFAQEKTTDVFLVISYKNIDVSNFNYNISYVEKKKEDWIFNPILIAMRFHSISDVRFVNIKKNDRAECPLNSVITIVKEGFLDDQMKGRWIEFHLERKDCTKAWKMKELRQAYLCGLEGSRELFLKDLCPEMKSGKVTDVQVKMSLESVEIPCDYFPYTFDVKFTITVDSPATIRFQRIRSDGAKAPAEEIVFQKAGTKEFEDYYRVESPGDYWFKVMIISPNKISKKALSKVRCHKKIEGNN